MAKSERRRGVRPNLRAAASLDTSPRSVAAPDRESIDPMDEALRQATARWGSRAMVSHERTVAADGRTRAGCFVGLRGHDGWAWRVLGWGATWREAFALADATERGRQ